MNFTGGFDGGASQFAGGGFMATQGGGDGSGTPAPRKSSNNQTLRAVTVKQLVSGLANSNDDDYRIDGAELHNISLLGKVLSVREQSQLVIIELHDGTGKVEIRNWLNEDGSDQAQKSWRVGQYVRVHGHLRVFEKKRNVVAYCIRPVVDFNEVTYHFMQVIFQHLHITKGGSPNSTNHSGPSFTNNGFGATAAGFGGGHTPAVGGGFGGNNNAAANTPAGGAAGGPQKLEDKVLEVFNNPQYASRPNGVALVEVIQVLGGQYTMAQVKQAAEFLSQEGHVYCTVDDEHYKFCGFS